MFIRNLHQVESTKYFVHWGNGTSHRLLTVDDHVGFSVCHTVVNAGSESLLEYRNHIEACYCIAGSGEIEDMHGNVYAINVGDLYVMDEHDKHYLRAGIEADMVLVSIFNPALEGTEKHDLDHMRGSHSHGSTY